MVTNIPLLASIALLNATVYQQQQYLIQTKQEMICQYFDEPLRSNDCDNAPGNIGHRIITWVPLPNQQMPFCLARQELEPCSIPVDTELIPLNALPEPWSSECDFNGQLKVGCRYKSAQNQDNTLPVSKDLDDLEDCLNDPIDTLKSNLKSCTLFEQGIRARRKIYKKNGKFCNFFTLSICDGDCQYIERKEYPFGWCGSNEISIRKDYILTNDPENEEFCPRIIYTIPYCQENTDINRLNVILIITAFIITHILARLFLDYNNEMNFLKSYNDVDKYLNEQLSEKRTKENREDYIYSISNVPLIIHVLFRWNFNVTNENEEPAEKNKKSKSFRYYCCCQNKTMARVWGKLFTLLDNVLLPINNFCTQISGIRYYILLVLSSFSITAIIWFIDIWQYATIYIACSCIYVIITFILVKYFRHCVSVEETNNGSLRYITTNCSCCSS